MKESLIILNELFEGSNKKFIFNSSSPIDSSLYEIYNGFLENSSSIFFLSFSGEKTDLPFVSFNDFGNHSLTIKMEDKTLFIYEKK